MVEIYRPYLITHTKKTETNKQNGQLRYTASLCDYFLQPRLYLIDLRRGKCHRAWGSFREASIRLAREESRNTGSRENVWHCYKRRTSPVPPEFKFGAGPCDTVSNEAQVQFHPISSLVRDATSSRALQITSSSSLRDALRGSCNVVIQHTRWPHPLRRSRLHLHK